MTTYTNTGEEAYAWKDDDIKNGKSLDASGIGTMENAGCSRTEAEIEAEIEAERVF